MHFIGSAKLVGSCTLLSRMLGLVREIWCAKLFGAGLVWDAFSIAFLIPNLFRRIFGEGALTAAFIPVFVERLEKNGKESAFSLLRLVAKRIALVLLGFVILGWIATLILPTLYPTEKMAMVCQLLQIMLPYLIFICIAAILGAALNSLHHFLAPALAPVVLNLIWIGALVLIGFTSIFGDNKSSWIIGIAIAIIIGGVVEFVMQIPPLLKRGMPLRSRGIPSGKHSTDMKQINALFLPVVLGLSVYQVNEMVDYLVAELCVPGHGAVSALWYGSRLMQLPMAVIGTAIAVAVFPLLSANLVQSNPKAFTSTLRKAIQVCFYIAIPASVGMIALSTPLIQLLFERGEFKASDTARASAVLIFYALSIWCYSVNQILVRAFYAQKDTKTPVKISLYMVIANFLLNIILVWTPLREAGLALATAITGCANFILLLAVLKRRFPELDTKSLGTTFSKSLGASLLMALAIYLLIPIFSGELFSEKVARVVIPVIMGTLIYLLITSLLKMEEVRDVLGRWFKR